MIDLIKKLYTEWLLNTYDNNRTTEIEKYNVSLQDKKGNTQRMSNDNTVKDQYRESLIRYNREKKQ